MKELIPVVLAAAIWGAKWEHSHVWACSDNSAVVAIINGGYSKNADVMHLYEVLTSAYQLNAWLDEAAHAFTGFFIFFPGHAPISG